MEDQMWRESLPDWQREVIEEPLLKRTQSNPRPGIA
jgi:hypothetical protein